MTAAWNALTGPQAAALVKSETAFIEAAAETTAGLVVHAGFDGTAAVTETGRLALSASVPLEKEIVSIPACPGVHEAVYENVPSPASTPAALWGAKASAPWPFHVPASPTVAPVAVTTCGVPTTAADEVLMVVIRSSLALAPRRSPAG